MKDRRRLALALIGIAVSVASIVLLAGLVDIGQAAAVLASMNPSPIALALTLVVVQLLLRTVRWSYLLERADRSRPRTARLVPVLLVGYLGNTVLPGRLGEVARAYLASRREQAELSRTLGTVLLERVIDVATLAAVAWVVALLLPAPAWIVLLSTIAAIGGLAIVTIMVAVDAERLVAAIRRRPRSLPGWADRVGAIVIRFGDGAGGQRRSVIGLAIAISTLCWLLDGTIFWLAANAVGADMAWAPAMIIAAITVLGTAVPSAPGYVGTYELAAVAAATALGIPAGPALAAAVLAHLVTTLPLALGGVLSSLAISVPAQAAN